MKKITTLIIVLVLSMQLLIVNVFAGVNQIYEPKPVSTKSNLLDKNQSYDKVTEKSALRGNFFMGADLVITDEGNGNVGALATAYLEVPVEEVYIRVYLDQYNEDNDTWYQVAYYDAEFYEKDYPDGINYPSVNITFQKVKRGYYYRLRSAFSAVKDNQFEGFSPVTSGIWIE